MKTKQTKTQTQHGPWSSISENQVKQVQDALQGITITATHYKASTDCGQIVEVDDLIDTFTELPMPLPQQVVAGQNLPLPGRVVLPEIFSYPAGDIAQSTKDYDVQRGCDVEAAKLYLAIFDGTHFKRLLLPKPANDESVERKLMWANLPKAHECLVNYLRAMVKQARRHVVKIGKDMAIEIDGETVETKGAAKRALLALALMRDKMNFSTAEFSHVFYGTVRPSGELASEFTTAIRDAKKLVRGLSYKSDNKGHRTVSGIYFAVLADDAQLKQSIAELLTAAK